MASGGPPELVVEGSASEESKIAIFRDMQARLAVFAEAGMWNQNILGWRWHRPPEADRRAEKELRRDDMAPVYDATKRQGPSPIGDDQHDFKCYPASNLQWQAH